MIIADYHTHTVFSHGKGTIEENVKVAREKGLKEIAITDHGLKHVVFGLRPHKVRKMRKIVDELNKKYTDINILLGVEANLISHEGDIDIKPHQRDWFDIVICGYHKLVWGKSLYQFFSFIFINNWLQIFHLDGGKKRLNRNTDTLIKAVRKNKIDILVHPNHDMQIDAERVAKVAKEYGTLMEISSKKVHLMPDQIKKVIETGVGIVADSDAHDPNRVGDFALSKTMVNQAGYDESIFENWDKLPKFRSVKRKKNDK